MKILVIPLIISELFFSFTAMAGDECRGLFAKREIINSNASTAIEHYSRPNFRALEGFAGYESLLGEIFTETIGGLRPGAVLVDVGGGFGVAALLKSIDDKVISYVINAQDNWKYYADGGGSDSLTSSLAESLKVSLRGIPTQRSYFDRSLNIDGKKILPKHFKILRQRVLEKVLAAHDFNFIVGYAEEKLPSLKGVADVLSDNFGAFFYSANRAEILDLYYQTLKPKGRAFIKVENSTGVGVPDRVWVRKARSVSISQYLVETYPDIFSFDEDVNVLIMKKNKNVKDLGLRQTLAMKNKPRSVNYGGIDTYHVDWVQRGP